MPPEGPDTEGSADRLGRKAVQRIRLLQCRPNHPRSIDEMVERQGNTRRRVGRLRPNIGMHATRLKTCARDQLDGSDLAGDPRPSRFARAVAGFCGSFRDGALTWRRPRLSVILLGFRRLRSLMGDPVEGGSNPVGDASFHKGFSAENCNPRPKVAVFCFRSSTWVATAGVARSAS